MTCFWDALRSKLNISSNIENFIIDLKNRNNKNKNILWNNTEFTDKQIEENYSHINDFNEKNVYNGYDCSICDPFLILICDLYNISIHHNYMGYNMIYENKQNVSGTILYFQSDSGHFW